MTNARALAYRMHEAFNTRNFEAVDDIFTPDFFSHPMGTSGAEHVKETWSAISQKFPDMHSVVDDVVADGDLVSLRATISGLSAEDVTLMEMFRVEDGRIAELWGASQSVGDTVRDLL
jgi:predicted SnoaL-like aldol condensation-catalyzing enzyme